MSVCAQACAARRRARKDPRHQGFRKDASRRAQRMAARVNAERLRQQRKKK